METKETINTESAKSVKGRLDELRELCRSGYITDSEFKIARVNVLKDEGFDVVTQHVHRPYFREEEEPRGCGCFLVTLLLSMFLVLGVAFFAAPYWPDRFGGVGARMAREWFTAKGTELIDRFFSESSDSIQVPDPISPGDEHPEEDTSDTAEPVSDVSDVPDESEDVRPNTEQAQSAALPSFNIHILSLPSDIAETNIPAVEADTAEPDITVIEVQPPVPADNAIRGHVTASNARIRSAPDTSTNDNVVGWARTGDRFSVLGDGPGRDGSTWYNVIFENGNRRGWISGSLVRLEE